MKIKFYADIYEGCDPSYVWVRNALQEPFEPKSIGVTRCVFAVDFPDHLFPSIELGEVKAEVEKP